MEQKKKWVGTTFGNAWMHHQLIYILKFINVRVLYVFAYVFIVPLCLIMNASRGTAYRYFRKRMGYGKFHAAWSVYINHCMFSQVVIDRFAMFAGKQFEVTIEGYDHFLHLSEYTDGFVMLSSHIGCYEVAGYSLVAKKKRFNALVFGGEKNTIMEGRREMLEHNNIRMIPVKSDMSHLFLINESLANHEIVSMPADRIVGSSKSVEAIFLGAKAQFPLGPFLVATMRNLDVIAVNVMKISSKGYKVYVTPLSYDKDASRKMQVQQLVKSYVVELEQRVRQYPEQWYNFYEFWS